jgi:hypothetical protein
MMKEKKAPIIRMPFTNEQLYIIYPDGTFCRCRPVYVVRQATINKNIYDYYGYAKTIQFL